MGHEEDDKPRMVKSPWFEEEIPFDLAAETGTRKVIRDHSTIGIVVTTDGSISEIPRENYLPGRKAGGGRAGSAGQALCHPAQQHPPGCPRRQRRWRRRWKQSLWPHGPAGELPRPATMTQLGAILQHVLYEFPVTGAGFCPAPLGDDAGQRATGSRPRSTRRHYAAFREDQPDEGCLRLQDGAGALACDAVQDACPQRDEPIRRRGAGDRAAEARGVLQRAQRTDGAGNWRRSRA